MRSLLSNAFFTLVSDLASRISWTLLMIFTTRRSGAFGAGIFSIGSNYVFMLLPIVLWGLDQVLVRDVAGDLASGGRYFVNFLVLRISLAIVTWAGLAAFIWLGHPYRQATNSYVAWLGGMLLSEAVINLAHALFVILDRSWYSAAVAVSAGLLRLVSGVFVLVLDLPLDAMAVALVVTGWAQAVVLVWLVVRLLEPSLSQFDLVFCSKQLGLALPFVLIGLLIAVEAQIGSILLSFFRGEEAVGAYGMANTLISGIALVSQALRVGVFPVLTRLYDSHSSSFRQAYERLWRYLSAASLPLVILVWLFANPMLTLLYGLEAVRSVRTLQILAPVLVCYFLNIPSARMMILAHRQRTMMYFFIVSTIANLAISFLGGRILGAQGIAVARVISMSLLFVLNAVYVHSRVLSWSPWPTVRWSVVAALGMLGVILLLPSSSIGVQGTLGTVAYGLLLVGLGGVPKKDRQWLRDKLITSVI